MNATHRIGALCALTGLTASLIMTAAHAEGIAQVRKAKRAQVTSTPTAPAPSVDPELDVVEPDTAPANAGLNNTIEIGITRADDVLFADAEFLAFIDINVAGVPGVTEVQIAANGVPLFVEDDGDGLWVWEDGFDSLAALKTAMNGTWIIGVVGLESSVTTMFFDANSLTDGDFYGTPTIVSPLPGSTGDSPATFEWTDPTGADTPDVLVVEAEGETVDFGVEAVSLFGDIAIDATTWNPGVTFPDDIYEYDIAYLNFDATRIIGPLQTIPLGSISWSSSPVAPVGYPAGMPLVITGSETIATFTVGVPIGPACPADNAPDNGDGTFGNNVVNIDDLIGVINAFGDCAMEPAPCPWDNTPDNGDGTVGNGVINIDDVITVITSFGACPS
ncbi:MAG: hypothetical protein AAF432_05965 [Planctomycetota bacterium]